MLTRAGIVRRRIHAVRPVWVVANPVAGRRDRSGLLASLVVTLREHGIAATVRTTGGPGDATTFAREVPDDAGAIVAVGGDGTVNEILEGLRGRDVPLAVLPVGTANVLAAELRLPRTPEEVVAMLAHGAVRRLDGGVCNDRRFVLVTSAGFDGVVVHRHDRQGRGHNSYTAYVGPVLSTIRDMPLPRLQVEVDGTPIGGDVTEVIVANVRNFGNVFEAASHAVPDDGLFDIVTLEGRSRWRWFTYLCGALVRQVHRLPGVRTVRGRHVRVTADEPVPVQYDGDPRGHTPLEITIEPGAVPVIVPRT